MSSDYRFENEESSLSSQKLHFDQSLWLRSPHQTKIDSLYKRQEESCIFDTSRTDMERQLSISEKRTFEKCSRKENIISQESQISVDRQQQNGQKKTLIDDLDCTFQNNFRSRDVSFDQNKDRCSISENTMKQPSISPLKRLESNKKLNVKSTNAQKELLNRFMMIYQKNKYQLTTLDVIVKLKTKLKYFFRNYTSKGRAYILKENTAIRQYLNDKSDLNYEESSFEKSISKQKKNIVRQTSIFDSQGKQNYFKQFFELVGNNINKITDKIKQIKVIKPHQDWVIILRITFIVLNYIFFFLLSLLVSFDDLIPISTQAVDIYNGIILVQWILEIFIKLNTEIYNGGQYVNERMTIFKLYLRGSFIWDIIPVILLEFSIGQSFSSKVIRLILFVKLINTIREQRDVEKILLMRIQHHYYIDMFNLVVNIHIVGHIIALGFYVLSVIEEDYLGYEKTWKDNVFECNGEWWRLYLESMFWSFTLMTTGSNIGTTMPEVLYVTVIMMLVFILFGYIINMIGFIIVEMQKTSDDKKKDINVINKYMTRKHTSKELKHKVNLDLEYYYQRNVNKKSDDEENVLGKISGELSDAIQLEYNKKIISNIKFLNKNFSQFVLDQLCVQLEESFYSPNQTIYKEDQLQIDPPIIFLISGNGKFRLNFEKISQFSLFFYQQSANIMQQVKIQNENNGQENKNLRRRQEHAGNFNANSQRTIVDNRKDDDNNKNHEFLQVIGSLNKGQAYGVEYFFTGNSNPFEIISTDFSTVLKLERSVFLKILKDSEKDLQIFNEIKDKALFMQDFQGMGLKCQICRSFGHQERECPKCHHNRDNQLLFYKLNKNQLQERQDDYVRHLKERFNALNDMTVILRDVDKIIDQIEILTIDDEFYESFEINELSVQEDSKDIKESIYSLSEEKVEKANNEKGTQHSMPQSSQQAVRQATHKLSINPVKFDSEKGGGSMTDILDKNPSYLSAQFYSKQTEDESNISNYGHNQQSQQRHGSIVVGSHLQPVSYKSQLDTQILQQPQIHRDILKDVYSYIQKCYQKIIEKQQKNSNIYFILFQNKFLFQFKQARFLKKKVGGRNNLKILNHNVQKNIIYNQQKSLTSIKDRDLHSQISQVDRKRGIASQQNPQALILEELQKIYTQFTMMQNVNNRRLSYINTPSKLSKSKANTGNDKNGTIYEQQIFAEERMKQDEYWSFESLQDYQFYFPDYNHQQALVRFTNLRKKFQKDRTQSLYQRQETSRRIIKTQKTMQ